MLQVGGKAKGGGAGCCTIAAGADVEEPDGDRSSEEGGAFLMCIAELSVKSAKKNANEITVGFLVHS